MPNISTLLQPKTKNQYNISNNHKSTPTNVAKNNNTQFNSCSLCNSKKSHPNAYLINFGAMNKSMFPGVSRVVVDRFDVPYKMFKVLDDFVNWCGSTIAKMSDNLPDARSKTATQKRKSIFKEWKDFVTAKENGFSSAMKLVILSGLTAGLRENNDKQPPALNKKALAKSVTEYENEISKDEKKIKNVSFRQIYDKNIEGDVSNDNFTGWIYVNKPWIAYADLKNQAETRHQNHQACRELQDLSFPAEFKLTPDIKAYLTKAALAEEDKRWAEAKKVRIEQKKQMLEAKYEKPIEELGAEELYPEFGIRVKKDEKDGKLILLHYQIHGHYISLEDLGHSEQKLFKNIKVIEGDADFTKSTLNSLKGLESIGGTVYYNPENPHKCKLSMTKNKVKVGKFVIKRSDESNRKRFDKLIAETRKEAQREDRLFPLNSSTNADYILIAERMKEEIE